MKAVSIRCVGRVQGVFFRASTVTEARRLGISGTVRNESNGDVLIHAQGESAELNALIRWCHVGPPLAKVTQVDVAPAQINARLRGFEIDY